MNDRKGLSNRESRSNNPRDTRWDYSASSQKELLGIGSKMFRGPDQNRLDEQVQMTHLLGSLATTSMVQFPLRASHVPDEVPDFQLELAGHRIGIELTKIAVPDVEHARAVQNRGLNRTLGISSLLRRKPKPRSKSEVVAEGFTVQQMVYPLSLQEHREIWLKEAAARLDEKTRVLRNARFRHGNEDWLLLWDRIGTADWELQGRIQTMIDILSPRWRPDWYSRVIVQGDHFDWQYLFSTAGATCLPHWRF